MGQYKNVNYIKPDPSLILVSNPEPAFNLDDTNPKPAFDINDIHDSDDDKKSVLSTPSFLSKQYTSILPSNKNKDEDI